MSKYMSGWMPGRMPECLPDRMTDRMLEYMPDWMPTYIRQNARVWITRSKVICFWVWHVLGSWTSVMFHSLTCQTDVKLWVYHGLSFVSHICLGASMLMIIQKKCFESESLWNWRKSVTKSVFQPRKCNSQHISTIKSIHCVYLSLSLCNLNYAVYVIGLRSEQLCCVCFGIIVQFFHCFAVVICCSCFAI